MMTANSSQQLTDKEAFKKRKQLIIDIVIRKDINKESEESASNKNNASKLYNDE